MADVFKIKRNDTGDALEYTISPSLPAGVSVSSAVFNMRLKDGATTISRAAATVVAATGRAVLQYTWTAANTATAGDYVYEFETLLSNGQIKTYPNDKIGEPLKIEEDI